jgi:multidrug efflux pump subunit AcrA (membrane-fusion protein)
MRADDRAYFKTLESIRIPRVLRTMAIMLGVGVVISIAFLLFVPWVQTIHGVGRVSALEPRDRVQNVTALVPGRIAEWYVAEGVRVRKGDPVVRIVDNDPQFIERLKAERDQLDAEARSIEVQIEVAQRDVKRLRTLVAEGLSATRDLEIALLKVEDLRAKLAAVRAKQAGANIQVDRQQAQLVRAPRDGVVQQLLVGDIGTFVKEGEVLMTFAPSDTREVVELFVDGRDVIFIDAGRRVRLEFEGWPAVQVSGWPSIARGFFDGVVYSVDAAPAPSGLYRVLVLPAADRDDWPPAPTIRLGAKTRGWVMMETVTIGYEIWRQLNDFPLEFKRPIDREQRDPGAAPAETNG